MTIISKNQLQTWIEQSQKGKRMPLHSALCKSMARPLISKDQDEIKKGLQTSCTSISTKPSAYWTSIAVLDVLCDQCSNTIVLGSVGADDNLSFYKDQCIDDALSYPRFQNLASGSFSNPVHSLARYGESLLVGSNKGVVKLMDVQRLLDAGLNEAANNEVQKTVPQQLAQYVPSDIDFSPLPTYGISTPNTHVKAVQFSRRYSFDVNERISVPSLNFAMIVGTSLYIWDFEYESAPIYTKKFGAYPLNACHWSPHQSYNLIATAGSNGNLDIIDSRVPASSTPAWSSPPGTHKGGIHDVQFSPIIPYWVASAGDDSITQIWDIRYSHAVAKIEGHSQRVNSVVWGNMHAEIVCTVSSDQTFKMWSLTPGSIPVRDTYNSFSGIDNEYSPQFICSGAEGLGAWSGSSQNPVFIGEDIEPCHSPVVQVQPSQHWRNLFYCITRNGQLTALNIRRNTRESLVPHRYDAEKDPLAFEIEKDVFGREVDRAYESLHLLKSKANMDDRDREIIKEMDELITFSPPIDPSTWQINSLPKMNKRQSRLWNHEDICQAAVVEYEKELTHWTRYLPPGITHSYTIQHLPTSLVKTVQDEPLPVEEQTMSPDDSMFESFAPGELKTVPSTDSFFAGSQNSYDDVKPKHKHHNPFKPALKSLKRTMTLSKRKDTPHVPTTPPGLDKQPSGSLSRTSTRRHALL